jgi:glycosyltransferase involved in cell wall biosynthesis
VRIAIVSTSYPDTPDDPAGHFVRAEAKELARAGDHVTVIAPSSSRHAGVRDDEGITVRSFYGGAAFGWPGVAVRLSRSPLAISGALEWVYHARNCVTASDAELVLAHWVVPSVLPIAASRSRSVGVVGVSHGADVRLLLRMPAPIRVRVVRRLLDAMSTWRFVSNSLRDSLLAGLPRAEADAVLRRSEVRASPFELPVVDPVLAKERRRSLDADRLVSVVGRLTKGKRVHSALDYAHARGRGTHVVIVGDGPERESLERYARARGVSATFVGKTSRKEAALWIASSDELVIASRAEGLSTVAREAEQLGVPVRFL